MTTPRLKTNMAASVRDRLRRLAHARKEDFNFVLNRYAMERLLYRMSKSSHAATFILKGANLFTVWSGHPHRATKDIDLLGAGPPELDRLGTIFREICAVAVEDDGVAFDPACVTTARIREDANYEGVRVEVRGTLGSAVLNVQVDIGFGDAITPSAVEANFPVLLGSAAPKLRIYPRETVVAEKLEAMVQLGMANSRMKDFFDVRFLARSFDFDGDLLTKAIAATFTRRKTPVPSNDPVAFSSTFVEDPQKNAQWTAFLKRSGASEPGLTLPIVVAEIRAFLDEPLVVLRGEMSFAKRWSSGAWR